MSNNITTGSNAYGQPLSSLIENDLLNRMIDDLLKFEGEARSNAARTLGGLGDKRAVQPLMSVLEDHSPDVREAAAASLWTLRAPEAVRALEKRLEDSYFAVRECAAAALGRTGDEEVIKPLIDTLVKDPYPGVRAAAAITLGRIWGRIAADAVLNALSTSKEPPPVDETPWESPLKGRVEDALTAALKDGYLGVREAATRGLALFNGEPEGKPDDKPCVFKVRLTAGCSTPVEQLIHRLYNWRNRIRPRVVAALGRTADYKAINPLLDALKYGKGRARAKAAVALGTIGSPRGVDSLIAALHDPSYPVRRKAVIALKYIGDPRCITPLVHNLGNYDPDAAAFSASVLTTFGEIAVTPLMTLAKKEKVTYYVRRRAVSILGRIGDKRAVPLLIDIMEDENVPNEMIKARAAEALGNIGDRRALEPLAETAEALAALGYGHLWSKAVLALGKLGDTRALNQLVHFQQPLEAEPLEILNRLLEKNTSLSGTYFCERCFCRSLRLKTKTSWVSDFFQAHNRNVWYNACRKCKSNSYFMEGIKSVVLLLDWDFEEQTRRYGAGSESEPGNILLINGIKRTELFDFDEIWIKNAGDYEVEKLVMKLRNDKDDYRRERMPEIPVYIDPGVNVSPGKMNLLKDYFQVTIEGLYERL